MLVLTSSYCAEYGMIILAFFGVNIGFECLPTAPQVSGTWEGPELPLQVRPAHISPINYSPHTNAGMGS